MAYDDTPKLNFSRIEYKYRISPNLVEKLKRELSNYMNPDIANLGAKSYTVCSIYFDSPSLTFGREKIEGDTERVKVRVRTYPTKEGKNPWFLEIKQKQGDRVLKERRKISQDEFGNLMRYEKDFLLGKEDFFYKKVWYLFYNYKLSPKIINTYQRYSFIDRLINCKISFDSEFSFSSINDENMLPFVSRGDDVVMEVKFDKYIPDYFLRMVKKYDLKRVSNSKYLLSLQGAYRKYQSIINN